MKDEVELPGQDFRLVIDTEESAAEKNTEQDNLSTKIADLSKRGYQLLKENDIQGAQEAFSTILELEENNNYALVGLGDSERKQNRFKDAIHYYNECLTHHPGNNYALFGLADCYKAMNQYHKAIDIWEQ